MRLITQLVWVAIAMLFGGASVLANEDFTKSQGRLTDAEFYYAIACKTPRGTSCSRPLYKWKKSKRRNLTVAISSPPKTKIPKGYMDQAETAVANAVAQINNAGSAIRIKKVSANQIARADIKVYLVRPAGIGRKVQRTGFWMLNGRPISNGLSVSATVGKVILQSGVAIAVDRVGKAKLNSVILEEIVQSLGLTWDIKNPYYTKKSVFAQSGPNEISTLKGQDAKVLRIHYPK